MQVAIIDTSFLFAYYSHIDLHHNNVQKYIKNITKQKFPLIRFILTDYVFSELITRIARKINKRKSIEIMEAIDKTSYIVFDFITPVIFNKAKEYYKKYQDKDWSFVDFTTYAYMKEKGISTIASVGHRHIKEFGFEIIP